MATTGQNRWPPPGTYLAATGHDLMAADKRWTPGSWQAAVT
jgi:hypothetical protein